MEIHGEQTAAVVQYDAAAGKGGVIRLARRRASTSSGAGGDVRPLGLDRLICLFGIRREAVPFRRCAASADRTSAALKSRTVSDKVAIVTAPVLGLDRGSPPGRGLPV